MKKMFVFGVLMLSTVLIVINSCKKEDDPPVCGFTYVVDGLTITFTSTSTNTDTYSWDFGDGETSTEQNPVHVYVGGGDYDVVLTVTGAGGTDTKEETITVVPSNEDVKVMLTGGASATNGKTWVLNTASITDGDGASAVEPTMLVLIPTPADFYGWLGKEGTTAKKDEFTFKYNGSYSIETKNDTVIGITLFSVVNGLTDGNSNGPYGTCWAKYTEPTGATWTLNDTDFTVDAITNPSDANVPPTHGNVTFAGKKWLSFSTGAYFGFLDFTTSSHVIIKSISPTQLRVALIVCMYYGATLPGGLAYVNYPTRIYHMTFVPK